MKRLSEDQRKAFAQVAKHNKVVVDFFIEWYMSEIEALPNASMDNLARAQGRCQVLKELRDMLQQAPTW